jgi:hypothetical protein
VTFGRYYLVEELRAMKADGLKEYFAQVGGRCNLLVVLGVTRDT